MIIRRVDDKTVKCFLSNEELEAYEIDYKDFILRSDKAKEVVQEIIEQAEEEVGYKPPRFAFDLQIVMVPEQGLELIFSEKDPLMDEQNGQQLIDCLKEMKQALQERREKINKAKKTLEEVCDAQKTGDVQTNAVQKNEAQPPKEASERAKLPEDAVFVFDSIHDVMQYAKALPKTLRVQSQLFVMEDCYYLYLNKGAASYERYSRSCVQALEFGKLYSAEQDRILHLREHGECIIEEKALKKLRLE